MRARAAGQPRRGFVLLEALIGLAVLAVGAAVVGPAFDRAVSAHRAVTQQAANLGLARATLGHLAASDYTTIPPDSTRCSGVAIAFIAGAPWASATGSTVLVRATPTSDTLPVVRLRAALAVALSRDLPYHDTRP